MELNAVTAPLPRVVEDTDVQALAARAHRGDATAVPGLARQFESVFLSQLLKVMRESLDEEEGLFGKDPADIQGGLFDQMMGKHLAEAGGIGLATMLCRQLKTDSPATTMKPGTTPCDRIRKKYHAPV
jgi:Rod binding domain-containing protein